MSGPKLALGLTLVLGTVAALAWPHEMLSPGVVITAHERMASDCLACHAPLEGPSTSKCLKCHPLHAIGLRKATGEVRQPPRPRTPLVHRSVVEAGAACDACHAEHVRGPGAASMRFRHDLFPPALRDDCLGCHATDRPSNAVHQYSSVMCSSCHGVQGWKPARFSHDELAPPQRAQCITCHAERRPSDTLHAAAGTACSSCHGSVSWKPATFEHQRYFRFDRNHPATCVTCHQSPSDFKIYTCYGCHEHTPARMQAEHRKHRGENLDLCARCHRSGDEDEADGRQRGSGGAGEGRRGEQGEPGEERERRH